MRHNNDVQVHRQAWTKDFPAWITPPKEVPNPFPCNKRAVDLQQPAVVLASSAAPVAREAPVEAVADPYSSSDDEWDEDDMEEMPPMDPDLADGLLCHSMGLPIAEALRATDATDESCLQEPADISGYRMSLRSRCMQPHNSLPPLPSSSALPPLPPGVRRRSDPGQRMSTVDLTVGMSSIPHAQLVQVVQPSVPAIPLPSPPVGARLTVGEDISFGIGAIMDRITFPDRETGHEPSMSNKNRYTALVEGCQKVVNIINPTMKAQVRSRRRLSSFIFLLSTQILKGGLTS